MSQREFNKRLADNIDDLERIYLELYKPYGANGKDFKRLVKSISDFYDTRKAYLRKIDINAKEWSLSSDIIGYTLNPELFNKSISKIKLKADYFSDLHVNLLHLMLEEEKLEELRYLIYSDEILNDNELFDDLSVHCETFKRSGIYSAITLNINSLLFESDWFKKAIERNVEFQKRFIFVDDLDIVRNYDRSVPLLQENESLTNFKYISEVEKYAFSSDSKSADLNYKNPIVFEYLVKYIFTMANVGFNMIILENPSLIWKQVGTSCHNRVEVHKIIEMLDLIKNIVSPSLVLVGSVDEEQHDVVRYFGKDNKMEFQYMYNQHLAINIWNSLATRDTRMLSIDSQRLNIPFQGAWINYIRMQKPIFWRFNEAAALALRWDPENHKQFLIQFFSGNFDGSFSEGYRSSYNMVSNDASISGRLASLIGLSQAQKLKERYAIENSYRKIQLVNSIILSEKGIPMIYFGDELGYGNNPDATPVLSSDNKEVNYKKIDWSVLTEENIEKNRIYNDLKDLISIKINNTILGSTVPVNYVSSTNHSIYSYYRRDDESTFIAICNFSEYPQTFQTIELKQYGFKGIYKEMLQNRDINLDNNTLYLHPYEFMWLKKD